jgi:hypothetical protein
MAVAKKQPEPSLKDQLLADYDDLEDRIENVSLPELWEMADWLAEYVPEQRPGRRSTNTAAGGPISISDLAGRRGRSEKWLRSLRKVAKDTASNRLDDVSPSTYIDLLQKHGDLEKANAALKTGTKRRDHRSGEGTQAIIKALRQKPKADQEQVARALYRNIGPVTIPDDDEPDDDYEQEDIEPEPIDPEASQTLRESYASCVTSTVEQHIDAIEGALKYLFETDMYKIGKKDRTRLRTILKKGLEQLDG